MGIETMIVDLDEGVAFDATKRVDGLFWFWLEMDTPGPRGDEPVPISRKHLLGLIDRDERMHEGVKRDAVQWVKSRAKDTNFGVCGWNDAVSRGYEFVGYDDTKDD